MKKLILILPLFLLSACTIVTQEMKNNEFISQEKNEKVSLSKIKKEAKNYLAELKDKENKNTLTKEDKETIKLLKTWKDTEEGSIVVRYSERGLTSEDLLTLIWATQEGYDFNKINDFLKLGLYTKNPYCEYEFESYQIFQVLSDYVLTLGCEKTIYDNCSTYHGKIYAFPKQEDELYYDKKILKSSDNFCSTYIGVHQYEGKDGNIHTVPILSFLPKNIDKYLLSKIEESRKTNK